MLTASTPELVTLRAEMRAEAEKAQEDRQRVYDAEERGEKLWGSRDIINGFYHVISPANVIAVLDADAATIKRLTRERNAAQFSEDGLAKSSVKAFERQESRLAELTAELETARGRVAELVEALEPFAEQGEFWIKKHPSAVGQETVGSEHLRRAARVLTEHAARKGERDGGGDA